MWGRHPYTQSAHRQSPRSAPGEIRTPDLRFRRATTTQSSGEATPYVAIAGHSTWRKGRRPPAVGLGRGNGCKVRESGRTISRRTTRNTCSALRTLREELCRRFLPSGAVRDIEDCWPSGVGLRRRRQNHRSHELLEALVTTSPFDHDAAVPRSPDDGPDDQRLTGKRPEPIPDRRLERVAEFVASGPPLDVD